MCLIGGFRNRQRAHLQKPCERHLRGCCIMRCGYSLHGFILFGGVEVFPLRSLAMTKGRDMRSWMISSLAENETCSKSNSMRGSMSHDGCESRLGITKSFTSFSVDRSWYPRILNNSRSVSVHASKNSDSGILGTHWSRETGKDLVFEIAEYSVLKLVKKSREDSTWLHPLICFP